VTQAKPALVAGALAVTGPAFAPSAAAVAPATATITADRGSFVLD
jgi:hypothetical protein